MEGYPTWRDYTFDPPIGVDGNQEIELMRFGYLPLDKPTTMKYKEIPYWLNVNGLSWRLIKSSQGAANTKPSVTNEPDNQD